MESYFYNMVQIMCNNEWKLAYQSLLLVKPNFPSAMTSPSMSNSLTMCHSLNSFTHQHTALVTQPLLSICEYIAWLQFLSADITEWSLCNDGCYNPIWLTVINYSTLVWFKSKGKLGFYDRTERISVNLFHGTEE